MRPTYLIPSCVGNRLRIKFEDWVERRRPALLRDEVVGCQARRTRGGFIFLDDIIADASCATDQGSAVRSRRPVTKLFQCHGWVELIV